MGRRKAWVLGAAAAAVLLSGMAVWWLGRQPRPRPDTVPQVGWELGTRPEAASRLPGTARARPDPLWKLKERVETGADAVVATAAQYIGLTDLEGLETSVELVVPEGDTTPFLSHLVNGRECYVVTFDKVEIRMPWTHVETGEKMVIPIRTLKALMDAESGTLLRVWSLEWLDPPSMRRTAVEIERSISQLDEEEWVGFPDSIPSTSLLEAMYKCVLAPAIEQLDAYYVTTNSLKGEGRATWQMIVRQRMPFGPRQDPEQEAPYPIYGWRTTADGETGEPGYTCSIH